MEISHLSLGAFFVVFFGGVLSFFSPCVAPLVPGYISFLSGAAFEEEAHAQTESEAGAPSAAPLAASAIGSANASTASLGTLPGMMGSSTSSAAGSASGVRSLTGRRRAAMVSGPRSAQRMTRAQAFLARGVGVGRLRLDGVMLTSLLFVLGFSLTFIVLGLLAGSFATLFAAYQPVMQTLAGIVMVAMGAFLLNLLPRSWSDFLLRDSRFSLAPRRLRSWGAAGPVVFGVFFAAGWSPCIGPVLAAVWAYAATSGSVVTSVALLSVYSLGFAVPFLAVGLGWSAGLRALGWIKRYGHAVSVVSGIVLILVGLIYLTGQVSLFATWAGKMTLP